MSETPKLLEEDPRYPKWEGWTGGVLLSDEIEFYCTQVTPKLIDPFNSENLAAARYKLTLGNEAIVGGKPIEIDEKHPLIIPPYQVAIVRTAEDINLPRFMIARWSLTVSHYYQGLLWTGAPQVDPGWRGYLPCPLYNLSSEPVSITIGAQLFTMDFVKTTKYNEKSLPYDSPGTGNRPYNPPLTYWGAGLRSAPYEALANLDRVTQELRQFRNEAETTRNYGMAILVILFTVLASVIAALGVVAVRPVVPDDGKLLDVWPLTAIVLSSFAFIASLGALAVWFLQLWPSMKRGNSPR